MYDLYIPEVSFEDFYQDFYDTWMQGEHLALIGKTGTGKTTLASDLLQIRDYVIALAVKRRDDTLDLFKSQGYRMLEYKPITGLTIPYNAFHVVIKIRPSSLRDTSQAQRVYHVLDKVFRDGGWCVYLDDTGYMTGSLGMKRPLVVLLSQARSNGTSVVTALVQPTSITQGVPTETLRQIRHLIAWRYDDEPSIESIARIGGLDKKLLPQIMRELDPHDFIYSRDGSLTIVRNTRS